MSFTEKERAFIKFRKEYPGEPLEWSAARAGYRPRRAKRTGRELNNKAKIRAAIDQERKAGPGEFTKAAIMSDIAATRAACIDDGGSTALKTRLEANIALAKMGGFFQERLEVGLDIKLLERIDAARKRVGKEPVFEKPAELVE